MNGDWMMIKIRCIRPEGSTKFMRNVSTEQYTTEELLQIIGKINKILDEMRENNGRT